MIKNIYLYLFVFTALIALYLGVMGNQSIAKLEQQLEKSKQEVLSTKEALKAEMHKRMELEYFSLQFNEDALAYTDDYILENPAGYISDKLLETNESHGNNPLVPYEGMKSFFKINKIKVLNHRWIIADFSDGMYWGEMFLNYEIKPDLSVSFTLKDHLLYSKSR
ncbi:MAG: hypothetical protein RLZZ241_2627 [Bacteroidota bacterium]|jgi:Na+-translocating ferredoxin:NAD+ oxidoreductase RnfG subunit